MPIRTSQKLTRDVFAPQPAPAVYKKIAYSFLGLTVVIVIGALWLSSVRARITVKMRRETANIDTLVEVAKSPEPGQLRGAVVQGTFEKVQEFSTTAQGTPMVGRVKGTVKIINNYSKPQTLVQTTRLLTADGRLYRIDKTVTVQPKESIQVTATADKDGAAYILSAGVRLTIPGLWQDLQKWIYAESVSGFSGGQSVVKVASDAELADAYATLEAAVFEQAKKTLQAEAGANGDWKVIYDKKVLDKKSNITAGQSADQFLASVKLEVTAVYYPDKEIDALIRQKLKDKMPEGRELLDFNAAQATYAIEQADPKLGKARLHIVATAASHLTEKSPQLAKANFLGLSEADAAKKLQSIEGVESVEIRIRPSWIHKVPSSESHVELIVQ